MENIAIYDPFNTRIHRLFNNFVLSKPHYLDDESGIAATSLKLDVSEDEKNYYVHADLPGVKKEDIAVTVDGNQVSISAEVKVKKEDRKGKNMIHCERYEGKTFRSFTLNCNVDESKSEAKFTDGVLELNLPKQTGCDGKKQIKVQ